MDISERISALRQEMEQEKIDIYIVPTDDFHQSEYVGEHFVSRQFITGFTGSAGTAVITGTKAGLWTDGRYFIQAAHQLDGSGIILFRSGEPGVDTIENFLEKELPPGGVIGFDGRTVDANTGKRYEKTVAEKKGRIKYYCDLIERIWKERPPLPQEKAWLLDKEYSGEEMCSKLARVREKMKKAGADVHLLSSLDDIAWLLNIRGNDIKYCPLVLSYLMVYENRAYLFADKQKFSEEIMKRFRENNIIVKPYDEVYSAISELSSGHKMLLDPDRINYTLLKKIPANIPIIEQENPEVMMKCCKNDTEIENIKKAHIKDAVAHIKFLFWLKKSVAEAEGTVLMDPDTGSVLTEISVAEKLEQFRLGQHGYLGPDFAPICAYGEHGAIVHYSAVSETNAVLHTGKMLLTDTGGHYIEGSTDITRTVALGAIPLNQKRDFTRTVRAMLRLMNTVFLHGCTGANLDVAAREVFWKERVNFNHGTGHGVGYLLNVHEAPVNFRWKESGKPAPAFERNMVISDEPGIYIENSHGIRIENLLVVCEDIKNSYGQFMRFEPLTYVPVDLDALIPEEMNAEERKMLNEYHCMVYEKTAPYLTGEERSWLKQYTKPV